ncbi:MAG: dUTP diphosphatase [SAR86 cluster bacterium]|uniref:dUTP diphosphatase n=1 Tax=SAR86 cluster bacterium TaxID=2030880 RepID=A0A2A4MLC6_9GAMM|nr:MAG: dUTP diphosphatase [SAR86 cluster bacterium]
MLSKKQVSIMLSLQFEMNTKVDPNWLEAKYPYLRAAVIEGAEAIEHHGWKWWKKQQLDLPQLQMELIDIWHFFLSDMLLGNAGDKSHTEVQLLQQIASIEHTTEILFDAQSYCIKEMDLLAKLELLIGLASARRIELALFEAIMMDCQLPWSSLFCQYMGKNILNFFRQDHGYKEGTYQKIWHGREDNEYLVELMATLDANDEDYQSKLYQALAKQYPS